MIKKLFQTLFFVPTLLTVLVLVSCQKELSYDGPEPTITEAEDSLLLIKKITYAFSNGMAGEDSIVENYAYDSVNRKITLSWNDLSENIVPDGSVAEFNYNDKWLLSRVVYKYPAGYVPQASDYAAIDIMYDAEKVLQQIKVEWGDGTVESKVYTKTLLSSGNYQLLWDETIPGQGEIVFRSATFNADGKNILNVVDRSFVADVSPAGDDIFTNVIVTDSLLYDPSGSVRKIVRTQVDTLRHTNDSFVCYEFTARQLKGDQLYNQRQGLMNGIANMPFGDADSPADAFGVLSVILDYESLQYSKYPIQAAKIYNWNGNDYSYTASSEFDNKDRLIKFKGFFLDIGLATQEYRIKYYK